MSPKVSFILCCALACCQAAAAPHFDFSLRDANGKTYTAADLRQEKATVLLFVATD